MARDTYEVTAAESAAQAAAVKREYEEAIVLHVLWGLKRAHETGLPPFVDGSISELAKATGIQVERLRRRLVEPTRALPGSYAHRTGSTRGAGGVSMLGWEYLYICEVLGISTNPYVRTDYDALNGVLQ